MLTLISGAAPGVEQGAIEAAVNLALHWQGWATGEHIDRVAPIYRTGLQPTSATDPGMVRRLNCQEADGALVFSTDMVLVGVASYVDRVTEQMGRAFLHVTLNPAALRGPFPDEVKVRVQEWIRKNELARVYVTGPSADDVPGIQGAVRDALIAILEPFAVEEVRQTTRAMALIEQAATLAPIAEPKHGAGNFKLRHPGPSIEAPAQIQCLNHGTACNVPGGSGPCRYEMPGLQGEREGLGRYRDHKFIGDGGHCELCGGTDWNRAHDWVGDVIVSEWIAFPPGFAALAPLDGPTDCRGEPLDLDTVLEPVDSAAPLNVHQTPPGPPEGLDDIQRAQLDASIREAERDIREPVEERVRAYHALVATAPGPIGGGCYDDEDDEPLAPGDQTA